MSNAAFQERLLSGDYSSMSITVCCQYPEQLDAKLRSQILKLSEGRKPHEEAYGKVENPCPSPANKDAFMSVELTIGKVQEDWKISDFACEETEDAYSYNFTLSSPPKKGETCFTLGIPVSSNYEYAMYIIKHMEAHFPSIKIRGGIECSCGCTFSNSLYAYEKIHVSLTHSTKNILKRLTEYGIIRSCISYYDKKWVTTYSKNGFFLKGHEENWSAPSKEEVPFEKYQERVDLTLSVVSDSFEQVFETAVSVQLPPPDFYREDPHVVKILEDKLEEAVPFEIRKTWHRQDWLYFGYVAFVTVDGKPVCEFRVRYQMKKYLLTLLELAESGMIDFIKTETYKWRNE